VLGWHGLTGRSHVACPRTLLVGDLALAQQTDNKRTHACFVAGSLQRFDDSPRLTHTCCTRTGNVLAGKALKDIETVVELFALHSIKKTDPKDPLKVVCVCIFATV